jgi:hypothetical protein
MNKLLCWIPLVWKCSIFNVNCKKIDKKKVVTNALVVVKPQGNNPTKLDNNIYINTPVKSQKYLSLCKGIFSFKRFFTELKNKKKPQ